MADSELSRVAWDLHVILGEVLTAERPECIPAEREAGWRFARLFDAIYGYCQTDLGEWHPCGEDGASWREDAASVGIDLSRVQNLRGAERQRDAEQRRLYAERMAPVLAERMLDRMRGGADGD